MHTVRWSSGLLTLAMAAGACVGNIGGDTPSPGTEQQSLCEEGAITVPATPTRRLTRREYDNAVRDLLGDDSHPAQSFVPDEKVGGFDANAVAPVDKQQVQDYLVAAETVAERAVAAVDEVLGCDVADDACVEGFVKTFGRRAFRRPLDETSIDELMAVYRDGKTEWGANQGFEMLVTTFLMSPDFLYVVELEGDDLDGDAIVALDGYEMAARLALFLWQSVPDDALLDAARRGDLDTREGIAEQTRRMVADDRAKEVVASFFDQWLEIEHLEELIKEDEAWTPELANAMHDETLTFADEVVRGGGSLETLLTASYTYGNAQLASLYGAEPPDADGRISLDPSERAGLLTQASFLARRAHAEDPSWVFRGKFVREALLCTQLPAPPPGVDMNEDNDPSRLTNKDCKECHVLMDPIGFGFDQYDAIGRYDASEPIENAELLKAGDLSGSFEDPIELAHRLADSDVVRRCMAQNVLRFATRRVVTRGDACSIDALDEAFDASGSSMTELLIHVTQSDAFRYRRINP